MEPETHAEPEPGPSSARILALDGLRGLAASSVVLAHAMSIPAKSLGAILELGQSPVVLFVNAVGGVHVFFVLSGYCLSSSASRARGARGLLPFYARRILRIHPPYLVALLVAWWLSGGVFDRGDGGGFLSEHAVDGRRLHIAYFKLKWALWFPGEAFGQIPVGWTLYVEMLFSFLLPFMLWLATRFHWLLLVAISIPALLFAPDFWEPNRVWQPAFVRYTLDFTLGVAIHLERDRLARFFARLGGWIATSWIAVGVVVLASPRVLKLDLAQPKLALLLYVAGSAMLVAAAIHSPGFRGLLSLRPIAWIGRISFSVYLIHMPVIYLLSAWIDRRLGFWGGAFFMAACLLTTYLVAPVLHRFVEQPCIRLGYRVSRWMEGDGAPAEARG